MISMSVTRLFQIINCVYFLSSIVSEELCPKVCSICFNDHLSCTSGGLPAFPLVIHDSTTKITLIGHSFENYVLSKANFSRYAKPRYSIEQLSIRKSNIDTIEPNTFSDLSGLDNLDLSDNRKMVIRALAFSNLKLKHLKLDQINTLDLQKGAFDDLMVASLSMKSSRMKTLDYSLLLPISTKLRNLFLGNNQIKHLESKFENLFQHLTILDLTNNPFQCTCDLAWLGRVVQGRYRRIEGGDASFSNNGFYLNDLSCDGPVNLRNRLIHNISVAEFSCVPPALDLIDVRFENPKLVRLQCSAKLNFKGSYVQVLWENLENGDAISYPRLENKKSNEAVTFVKRSSPMNFFRCLAISNAGNATVKITIKWPLLMNDTRDTVHPDLADKIEWFNKQKKHERNFFFKEQFTLLEMLGAVMGTFTVTLTAFLFLYRFCFRRSSKLKNSTSNKKSGYSVYEPAVYNDSMTYDVPQNNYSIAPQTVTNKTLPRNSLSHYIDYRTQQRLNHQ